MFVWFSNIQVQGKGAMAELKYLVAEEVMFKLEVSHEKSLELKAQCLFWMCEAEVTTKEKHGNGMWSKQQGAERIFMAAF